MLHLECTAWGLLLLGFTLGKVQRGCWPLNLVPYKIDSTFTKSQTDFIRSQIAVIHKQTCVRWVDEDETGLVSSDFVRFVKIDKLDCSTSSSQFGNGQLNVVIIRLHDKCFEERAVMHEMLHALGFKHEHQRPDRDCYVRVSEDKVTDFQYKIVNGDPWLERFPYDKYSIMHYKRNNIIRSRTERNFFLQPLGNAKEELTTLDLWKIKYKFCHYPHYCDVMPNVCVLIESSEEHCTLEK